MRKDNVVVILTKLERVHEDIKEIKESLKEKERRIDSLERFRAHTKGTAAVLVGVVGFFSKAIYDLFK